jgi:putative membrane protein
MILLSKVLAAFVALQHVGFLVLEMFLFRHPIGLRTFGLTPERAEMSATLAMNQGLYNGFLAAGLVWSLLVGDQLAYPVRVFFLACVVVAGVFGAATAQLSILFLQALPAAIALAVTVVAMNGAAAAAAAAR